MAGKLESDDNILKAYYITAVDNGVKVLHRIQIAREPLCQSRRHKQLWGCLGAEDETGAMARETTRG
jgi:hypothetical protein